MGSMAPPGQGEEQQQEQAKRGGFRAEDYAPRDELADMMARLGIYEPAAEATVAPPPRSWENSAAADRFPPAFLRPHSANDQSAYGRPASIVRAAGPAVPSPTHPSPPVGMALPPRDRGVPDARRFADGRLRHGGLARGPRPGACTPATRAGTSAAGRGVLPAAGDRAYLAPPPPQPHLHGVPANQQLEGRNLFSAMNDEQAVLYALSHETPEKIVSYACYLLELESRHGQRLFHLVFDHCHHQVQEWVIAQITRDRKSFCRLCVERTDEVVFMINSCETRRSMQLFRDAIQQWMPQNQLQSLLLDSKRLRVVHAFIVKSPPDIVQGFLM
nr:unnamed protein product [Digitaria exilis]